MKLVLLIVGLVVLSLLVGGPIGWAYGPVDLLGGLFGTVVGLLGGMFGLVVGLAGGLFGIVVGLAAGLFGAAVGLATVVAVFALPMVVFAVPLLLVALLIYGLVRAAAG